MENAIVISDGISIPLALIYFIYIVQSVRWVVIPLLSIAFSFALSFMGMYEVSHSYNVPSVAPNLMLALIIVMSIDYSLFQVGGVQM